MKALAIAVLNFIWPAMGAALAAYWAKQQEVVQEAQDQAQAEQDQIQQETQDEIDQVPGKSDADLLDIAIDTGLVRPDPSPGASRADDLADDPDSPYHRYSKTP